MPLISFNISSKIDLASCRELFKHHEKLSFPISPSFKDQITGLRPMYGICWKGENGFNLTRWRFVPRRSSASAYIPGIEMIVKVEGTRSEPLFVLQTKEGEVKRILRVVLFTFVLFGIIFGIMTMLATNKVTPITWLFESIAPLLLSVYFVFSLIMNAFLCRRFLKDLVNPKSTKI
jgi:hypothetical protein